MFGCCGAEGYKFRQADSENEETLDFVGSLINPGYRRETVFGVDDKRLSAICANHPPAQADRIKKCTCPCHVDGMVVLC